MMTEIEAYISFNVIEKKGKKRVHARNTTYTANYPYSTKRIHSTNMDVN